MQQPTHKLAKLMARAGYASRRDAERMILAGQVQVDGVMCDRPAERFTVDATIRVTGQADKCIEETRLYLYHKPRGLVTSHKDEQGRLTVFDALRTVLSHVVSVGRLDMESEGLLLLTNDGSLAGKLEKSGLPRRYRVRVWGCPTSAQIDALAQGLVIDGVIYAPIQVQISRQAANSWLLLTLTEGKNREIRRTLGHFGLRVNRLIRTHFGNLALEGLATGEHRQATAAEWQQLQQAID